MSPALSAERALPRYWGVAQRTGRGLLQLAGLVQPLVDTLQVEAVAARQDPHDIPADVRLATDAAGDGGGAAIGR